MGATRIEIVPDLVGSDLTVHVWLVLTLTRGFEAS